MAKRKYTTNRQGQPECQIETERATFREAHSTSGAPGRERCLILSITKHVGRVNVDLDLSFTHREALRLLTASAACLVHEGTRRTSGLARDLVNKTRSDQARAKPLQGKISQPPRPEERLLDDDAFLNPEQAVTGLTPVEALKLLEEAEPSLVSYTEKAMAAVMKPLRKGQVAPNIIQQVHREVIAMHVTALLTLRKAYRDLYADTLPPSSPTDGDPKKDNDDE